MTLGGTFRLPVGAALAILLPCCSVTIADDPKPAQYHVPDGGSAELLKFIEGLKSFRPRSTDEYLAHQEKSRPAIQQAATRLRQVETDKSSTAYLLATDYLIDVAPQNQQDKLVDEIAAGVKSKAVTPDDVEFAFRLAFAHEARGQRPLAAKMYTAFGEVFAQHKDPQIARDGRQMVGAALRLNLVGKTLELHGTKVDGTPFDLASLRGKVAIVGFWESGDEIYRADLSYFKELYDRQKPRGVEIVFIYPETDLDALKKNLAADKIPWLALHEKEGFGGPLTTKYGVFHGATVFLVDQQGKVIHNSARTQIESFIDRLLRTAR